MIRTETYELNGRQFIRTWSDSNRFVMRDGVEYSEACDPAEFGRTYTEGDSIPSENVAAQAEEIMNILLGGNSE